jgi:hypothetical protein
MVTNRNQHSSESRAKQALNEVHSNPNKIGATTPYDFSAKNLTPYGGLLPVATMLEKIGFQQLVEEALTLERITKVRTPDIPPPKSVRFFLRSGARRRQTGAVAWSLGRWSPSY